MAEGKYGRLFTERDVLILLRYAANRGDVDGIVKLGQVDGHNVDPGARLLAEFEAEVDAGSPFDDLLGLTFPGDEPLFLLRGQDLAAVGAIWGYCSDAERAGATAEFVTAVMKASNDMADWQRAHRDRLKVPD